MERFKSLKLVVYILTAIILFESAMLAWMLRPGNFHIWLAIGTILIVLLYLAVMSLGLIKELREIKEKTDKTK